MRPTTMPAELAARYDRLQALLARREAILTDEHLSADFGYHLRANQAHRELGEMPIWTIYPDLLPVLQELMLERIDKALATLEGVLDVVSVHLINARTDAQETT